MPLSQEHNKRMIPPIISLTLFMEAVDTTIINTAIPAMSRSLSVSPVDLKIALISYLMSLAIFIPISGWVADKFGTKRVYLTAVAIFTLSSIWCGFAHSLFALVLARIVQGLGGSLMTPIGRLIIVRSFNRNEFITIMSKVVILASFGPMLGPLLGGVITEHLSWRWIFWVNIPFGIIAMILGKYWLPKMPARSVPPLDYIGFLLFGIGLAGITFGLSATSESAVSTSVSILIIIISVLILIFYAWHSLKQPYPIVQATLFRLRTFRISILANLFARLGIGGVPFLLPLLLQIPLGYSAQLSGLLLVPIAFGIMVIKTFSKRLLQAIGFKHLLIINTAVLGFSLWSFALINDQTSPYFIALLTFIFGLLVSMQYSSMNPLGYAEVTDENLSSVTSIMSTTQQLAQSFGVAISAFFLRRLSTPAPTHEDLTLTVFHHTFLIIGLLTIAATVIFLPLKREDGQEMY